MPLNVWSCFFSRDLPLVSVSRHEVFVALGEAMAARRAFGDAEELVLRCFDEAAEERGWNPSALAGYRERLVRACRAYRSLLDGNEVGSSVVAV